MSARSTLGSMRPFARRLAQPTSSLSLPPSSSLSSSCSPSSSALPYGRSSRPGPNRARLLSLAPQQQQQPRSYSSFAAATLPRRSDFSRPAPPALPPHLQREFDELVRRAQTPAAAHRTKLASDAEAAHADPEEEMHPDLRRKPKPEFQGDRNPVTGEVGGPKVEPLKHGDWQYGGRATDF
ncbi:hypothetical protein JCM3774_005946 [Rhodotorula dairenensis]